MACTSTLSRRAAGCCLCQNAQRQIDLHIANGDRSRALRVISRCSKPQHQTTLHLHNRSLYACDREPGDLYFCGSIETATYHDFLAGKITPFQFERLLQVKFGVARNVHVWPEDYALCDSKGQTHLWIFFIPTAQWYRIEHLMHLDFLCRTRRSIRHCSGCYKRHREYWRLTNVGTFERIRARVLALLARIGEPDPQIIPLEDYGRFY
ncbi:hypothetical protein K438DRAFT_1982428 [Mycena galopus ATCC 62051]|nr:hypothetical protein K438DRAFT_1982428 [Mycena galopus ATCC 62051]